ncbi:hypothetical protein ABG775_06205 [Peribacillus simplex]|uniref:hypothetical protein n=1 Tax=Peribacillus simplex TaxID=1478 RepID=UPI003399C36A
MKKLSIREIVFTFIIIQFIILTTLLVLAFIFIKVTDSTTLVNQISLVSGVTSIILSVVAIIYAFIQSYSSSKQNTTVNNALDKVSDKVNELVTLKTDIADLKENLPYKLSHMIQNIEETKESVENTEAEGVSKDIIYSRLQELQNSLEDMLSKSKSQGANEEKKVFLIKAKFNKELEGIQINSHIRSVVAQLKRDLHPIRIGLSKSTRNGLEVDFRLNVYDSTLDSEQISKLLKTYPTDLMEVESVEKYI